MFARQNDSTIVHMLLRFSSSTCVKYCTEQRNHLAPNILDRLRTSTTITMTSAKTTTTTRHSFISNGNCRQRCYHHHHHHARHFLGPPLSRAHVLLINLILLIVQTSTVYSWSMNNFLIAGSQASIHSADTVTLGAQKGLNECARQFTYEQWPCPEAIFSKNIFRNSLPINREIAFVQAIISAGIVHTVTKNCHSSGGNGGESDFCRCTSAANLDHKLAEREKFRWGGCSEDIESGFKVAMLYLDNKESSHDFKAQIRRHNNEAGRIAIKENMQRVCKCHGVSGACSMQTCWMKMKEFAEVGNYLKDSYRKANKIESNENSELSIGKSLAAVPKWKLAYLVDSPDYCVPSGANGTTLSGGTLGRQCSMRKGKDVDREERNSCRRLCKKCGYGVKREKRVVNTTCNCKFKFCCEVKCDQCTQQEYTYVCAAK